MMKEEETQRKPFENQMQHVSGKFFGKISKPAVFLAHIIMEYQGRLGLKITLFDKKNSYIYLYYRKIIGFFFQKTF